MVPGPEETLFKVVRAHETTPTTVLGQTWSLVSNYDEYGNILAQSTQADGVDLVNTVERTYDNDPDTWLVGLLRHEEACSTALGLTQCRTTDLQRNVHGEVVHTDVGDPADPGTQLSGNYWHDKYGHVTHAATTDAFSHQRSACISYGDNGMFPYATANSLGHVTYTKYDSGLGVLTAVVDPNGLTARWAHDGFGRTVIEQRPDGTQTVIRRTRNKDVGPQSNWWGTTVSSDTDGGALSWTTLDSFGRTMRVRGAGPETNACGASSCKFAPEIVTTTTYDFFGRTRRVTVPWMSGDSLEGQLAHDYQYDAAGRLVSHTEPWGRLTVFGYANNVTTSLDWLGTTIAEVDALGRVVRTTDRMGYETTTSYGPFSAKWGVTREGVESNIMEHDAYGRVTHEIDPDRGDTYISYDGFGEATGMVDARGWSYAFTYDELGRRKRREDHDGTTIWTYDTAQYGIGKVATVESPAGHVKEYLYDELSRIRAISLMFGDTGQRLQSGYEYDAFGRLQVVTYPELAGAAPLAVRREYDTHGNVIAVWKDLSNEVYWTLSSVDGSGRAAVEMLGDSSNGIQARHEYYPNNGLLARIQTTKGSTKLQDLEYSYDSSLRMRRRTTRVGQSTSEGLRTEHFVHDELDRLTCAFFSSAPDDSPPLSEESCALRVAYAPNGNIEAKSELGDYRYDDPNHPHAVTAVSGGALTYAYDAVGNQVQRPEVENITYTAFDLPSRVDRLTEDSILFEYDGDQQRIRKTTPAQQTVYFEGLYEAVEDVLTHEVTQRYYIETGSATLVHTRSPASEGLMFVLTDALGSTDVVSDAQGNLLERQSFDAFGARRNPEWGEPPAGTFTSKNISMGYTGHESEDELGLVNMKGRIYDPKIGRFLQMDPVVSEPHFGQGWNAYSYVLDSPLNMVDPSGFDGSMTGTLSQGGKEYARFPGEYYVYDGPYADQFRVSRRIMFGDERVRLSQKDSARDDATSDGAVQVNPVAEHFDRVSREWIAEAEAEQRASGAGGAPSGLIRARPVPWITPVGWPRGQCPF